ncbi:hypothetical protein FGG65_gp29 [Corynebacterium phage phi673]|uniref:Uncharacterized protein n=1 Tax=Corynebacterium phage phi673 TaxID=2052821 RepID=A0A2H4PIT0_9CAUD|nr:hypothetical protein FGG65_gp29 [Corynebacterium phage phi673]ATW62891.1 hypothetical protein phi673_gp29 [Corynebacterium phage phi673]
MSTVQGNLRGALANLRNAGVFDSIQAVDDHILVTRGDWTIRYWVSADVVEWYATNKDETSYLHNDCSSGDYSTLLVEILNTMVGHFPVETPETKIETYPAREGMQALEPHTVRAGQLDKSHIGSTVTMPWVFREHEAAITGVLDSVKHDEYRTYFQLVDVGNYNQGHVYKCDSESVVVIHPEPEANDEVEDETNE